MAMARRGFLALRPPLLSSSPCLNACITRWIVPRCGLDWRGMACSFPDSNVVPNGARALKA